MAERRGRRRRPEEQTEFTATLTEIGPNKIPVIKVVRELTGLGLKEAKDVVDAAPKAVKEGITRDEAEKIKAAIEEAGWQSRDQVAGRRWERPWRALPATDARAPRAEAIAPASHPPEVALALVLTGAFATAVRATVRISAVS